MLLSLYSSVWSIFGDDVGRRRVEQARRSPLSPSVGAKCALYSVDVWF